MSARRRPLGAVAALLALAGGWTAAGGDPRRVSLGEDLRLERLEEGLWLYRATIELDGRPVESNGLVIGGEGGTIVIDTPWNDELTARLLDWIASRGDAVAAVVSTHFHADRLGGIAEVRRRGIASHGHAETARLARARDLPPPGSTFERDLTLVTGERKVELFFPGAGHSPDNVVVWLPEERLLFGGCLVKSGRSQGLGNVSDAVLESWPASLEALLARYPEATVVVPGHGSRGGAGLIRHTLGLVRRHADGVPAAARASRQRGVSWVAQPYEVEAENFDSLVAANVDWIVQTPFGWQKGVDGTEIALYTDDRVFWGERDVGLETTALLARERGIKTLLKPHVWLSGAGDKWRSDIAMASEEDWRRWFESYRRFILHYAALAERLEIEALCVGTELRRTVVERPGDWRALIADVRRAYSGRLTYAANWYLEYREVTFWDALDYIGIQAYFPLTDRERPSLAELRDGWQRHLAEIEELQRRVGKPVLFTEIGYRSMPGAAIDPWRWVEPADYASAPVDLELQADAYRAFFEVFWHRPWFAGAYFWNWHPRTPKPHNPDFTPQGKPAEKVLAEGYGGA